MRRLLRRGRPAIGIGLALALGASAGCGARKARGARTHFAQRFDCPTSSVHRDGDRWVVEGCRRRAEYECGFRSAHRGDLAHANCTLHALQEPTVRRGFGPGVRVARDRDGHPVVLAHTGGVSPRLELRSAPTVEGDVAVWRVSSLGAPTLACGKAPRVWIDGEALPVGRRASAKHQGRVEHHFETPLSPLRQADQARRLRVDLCGRSLVLANAERDILTEFAIRSGEVAGGARAPMTLGEAASASNPPRPRR